MTGTRVIDRRGMLRNTAGLVAAGVVAGCAAPLLGVPMTMPVDPAADAAPDLVDLARFEPRLRFDIRYATPNNFMGRQLYPLARAMAQRPVAAALMQAQTLAEAAGYDGLLIHDAYRPWRVTRMMWAETPAHLREFVADPRSGSRHNRGCAIDVTLRRGGAAVAMPTDYDDFTPAAYRSYTGGTAEQRDNRAALEAVMVAAGFDPLPNEWWHFDWAGWRRYPIMDVPLV